MNDPVGLINQGVNPLTPVQRTTEVGRAGGAAAPDFKAMLMQNIEQVNRLQQDAATAIEDLQAGRRDDVATVATAKAKSDLAFQMLLQARNKLMDAYEEVKQIRV